MVLKQPVIQDSAWESGAKFWCYFCEEECDKHDVKDTETASHGGFIKHLCLKSHTDNTNKFFFEHKLDREKKTKYKIEAETYAKFTIECDLKIMEYRKGKLKKILEESQKIRHEGVKRNMIAQTPRYMHPTVETPAPRTVTTTRQEADAHSSLFYTQEAHAKGLTCIRPKWSAEDVSLKGNVHSGGTPPWFSSDSESSQGIIGPTIDDLNKEIIARKKRKLPSNRVGAKFDRRSESETDWLPSFGRVWSKNSRTHSRTMFMKTSNARENPHSVVKPETTTGSYKDMCGPIFTVNKYGTNCATNLNMPQNQEPNGYTGNQNSNVTPYNTYDSFYQPSPINVCSQSHTSNSNGYTEAQTAPYYGYQASSSKEGNVPLRIKISKTLL